MSTAGEIALMAFRSSSRSSASPRWHAYVRRPEVSEQLATSLSVRTGFC